MLDYGLTIQEAIGQPRWIYGRTWGEESDALQLENRLQEGVEEQLRTWGHQVKVISAWDEAAGQAQGIYIGPDGSISGAADPRGDGSVIGW